MAPRDLPLQPSTLGSVPAQGSLQQPAAGAHGADGDSRPLHLDAQRELSEAQAIDALADALHRLNESMTLLLHGIERQHPARIGK